MRRAAGTLSPFVRLLGEDIHRLAPEVAALHRQRNGMFRGEVVVERGRGALVGLCAAAARLPPDYAGPMCVEVCADGDAEIWTRRFGPHVMRSRLWAEGGLLHERLGLLHFAFRLVVRDGALDWQLVQARPLGMPLPARAFEGVSAVASVKDGRYHFDVRAALPGVGMLVHYRGWLAAGS